MRRRSTLGAVAVAAALAGGCAGEPSVLDPAGDTAARLTGLWWLMLALGVAVWMLVVAALVVASTRRDRHGGHPPRWAGTGLVLAGGVALPVVVLVPLLLVVFRVADDLAPDHRHDDVHIEVVGAQFWWKVEYANGAIDANEVHVPVGRPITIELRSVDVIHSFWVPNAAGKVDLIPGEVTRLRFELDTPGTYRGFCAEFCGIQHARMRFVLVAHTADEYEAVVASLASGAATPDGELAATGRTVFTGAGCATCHTVRGTDAAGQLGPDLTHLASRRTIGAGAFPNTRGHLAGWIVDAQAMKPGNRMPPQPLDPDELEALLAYLESLE